MHFCHEVKNRKIKDGRKRKFGCAMDPLGLDWVRWQAIMNTNETLKSIKYG
jgi:hypothetical protein